MTYGENVNRFYDTDAEKSLIGAAIKSRECLKLVTETSPEQFYDKRNQVIHNCLVNLEKTKSHIDIITVDSWLTNHGLLDQAGGTAYIMECVSFAPATVGAKHHLQIINTCAMRRTLYTLGKELMEKAGSVAEPDETREWAARSIKNVHFADQVELISMKEAVFATYEKLENSQNDEDKPDQRIYSGIESLDRKLGGLADGEYIAIGARPAVGKSIFALQYCINAALNQKRVLLVSLEMSETQIVERMIANMGQVPLTTITSGNIKLEEWMGIAKVVGPLSEFPMWISLDSSTIEGVRRAAYQVYEDGGLDLIAIDYLQLMEATYSKQQNRQQQIAEISRGLRLLAQELKIPILVLTQLNRSSVKSSLAGKIIKRAPTMAEARESGSIEQDANIFIILHNPGKDEMTNEEEKAAWTQLNENGQTYIKVIIEKNRQGKTGNVTIAFDGDHMRFLPLARE